jgi:hypothetical protein
LEAEVVDVRKKVEKSNKFLNSSTILNGILDSQRSPNDKSGLGYNKEATHVEASTSKKLEVSPSLSNMEIMLQVNHLHKGRKISKEQSKEDIKKPSLHLKANSEERHLEYGHQNKGIKMFFMVIITHVMNMVTKLWNADIMQEEIMKYFITP